MIPAFTLFACMFFAGSFLKIIKLEEGQQRHTPTVPAIIRPLVSAARISACSQSSIYCY